MRHGRRLAARLFAGLPDVARPVQRPGRPLRFALRPAALAGALPARRTRPATPRQTQPGTDSSSLGIGVGKKLTQPNLTK